MPQKKGCRLRVDKNRGIMVSLQAERATQWWIATDDVGLKLPYDASHCP